MKLEFDEWLEATKNGTSGDMVMDILMDWKEERIKLIKEINYAIQQSYKSGYQDAIHDKEET